MSTITWLKESYPLPADQVPEEKAIRHCLKKWYGLRRENLNKHHIPWPPISINDSTCALCFYYAKALLYKDACKNCPLYQYLGRKCDEGADEYHVYKDDDNPEPMIEALEAIAMVERICK